MKSFECKTLTKNNHVIDLKIPSDFQPLPSNIRHHFEPLPTVMVVQNLNVARNILNLNNFIIILILLISVTNNSESSG